MIHLTKAMKNCKPFHHPVLDDPDCQWSAPVKVVIGRLLYYYPAVKTITDDLVSEGLLAILELPESGENVIYGRVQGRLERYIHKNLTAECGGLSTAYRNKSYPKKFSLRDNEAVQECELGLVLALESIGASSLDALSSTMTFKHAVAAMTLLED